MQELDNYMKSKIAFVASYVGNETTNWVLVKSQIVNSINMKYRCLFSRRHKTTQLHTLNSYENLVIDYWKSLTGVLLEIPEDQKQDPNYVSKLSYNGIVKLNRQRQVEAVQRRALNVDRQQENA